MKPIASSAPARQARRFPGLQRLATVTLVALAVAAASRSLPAQTGGAAGTATASVIATQPFSAVVIHPQRELGGERHAAQRVAAVGRGQRRCVALDGRSRQFGAQGRTCWSTSTRSISGWRWISAQAALDASLARLKQAEQQLVRSQALVAKGFFSQEALAQRETEVALHAQRSWRRIGRNWR
jgi:hypothetical protein